jgi:hypothetical protein
LNQPKKPFLAWPWPSLIGLRKVAHNAGVSDSASKAENAIEATMVTENWR